MLLMSGGGVQTEVRPPARVLGSSCVFAFQLVFLGFRFRFISLVVVVRNPKEERVMLLFQSVKGASTTMTTLFVVDRS